MTITTKRTVIMVAVVGLVIGLLYGFQVFKGIMIARFMTAGALPPQTVSTAPARFQDWQPSVSAVGSFRAVRGTDLSVEVPGIVDRIHFESGEEVKAGTVLLSLRMEDDEARLRSLESAAQLAASTYERNLKQFEAKAISRAALDVDAANVKSTQAAVAEQRAQLNKKVVRAPFSGRLGVRAVDVGQYINPGAPIVTLQALDPIYADFYLPVADVARIAVGRRVVAKTDAKAEESFEGEISAINPKVDVGTRNVLVRATFSNESGRLLPGTSASIVVDVDAPQRHLTLPQTAIMYNPYGDTVYLAIEDGKDDQGKPKLIARQTFVVIGPARGDQVAILEGLKEGDVVVTAGQIKLQGGTPLVVNNSLQPPSNPNPRPVQQ